LLFFGKKRAAQDGPNAEKREYILGNIGGGERRRLASGSDSGTIAAH
jgi:hypothetical protein